MKARYDCEKGHIFVSFEPDEVADSAFLMQLVWEEECEKGHIVPNFQKKFFVDFAASRRRVEIRFNYDCLGFMIIFLEEVCIEWSDEKIDIEPIIEFLYGINEDCHTWQTLH